jgi:hypothetical protein
MKTFLLDIIPQIQRFSQKLDNLTVLTNKHWVLIDEELTSKVVFIFREKDSQLLISENGKIEKGTWEYLGNNSLLIDRKEGSYLFRHGFIDETILALKVDGKEEYALLVNELKFNNNLNSITTIVQFLKDTYSSRDTAYSAFANENNRTNYQRHLGFFQSDKGEITVELNYEGAAPKLNNKVFQNNVLAKDGKYKLGFMYCLLVKDGFIEDITLF